MKIIRDEEGFGLFMIPLFVDWHVKRCNVEGCTSKRTTIVTEMEEVPIFGLCEEHFKQANVLGGTKFDLEWDDFDAFKTPVVKVETSRKRKAS